MDVYTLNREETLLLVIDIQERLARVMEQKDEVIRNTQILLRSAREMDIPVVTTEQYPKGLGPTVAELSGLLDPGRIFSKNSFTACTGEVSEELSSLGRKKILIAGMETHVCGFQTCRDLIGAGFQVFLVRDAVCSRSRDNWKNGLELIKEMGGRITNTETAVFDLLKVSGTEEFRTLSKLIK